MFPATRRSSKRSVVYKPFGFLIRNGPVDVLSMFTTEKRAYDNTPRRRQSRHVAEWNACVWTTSGSRYVMFMSTFRRIVVCTLYGSLYATLRKPDSVHPAQRLDVDRTVAYGKNKWLDTTLWRPSRIGKRMACIRHIHIHIHIYTYACTTSGLRYATVLLTSRRSDECTPLGSRNFAKL